MGGITVDKRLGIHDGAVEGIKDVNSEDGATVGPAVNDTRPYLRILLLLVSAINTLPDVSTKSMYGALNVADVGAPPSPLGNVGVLVPPPPPATVEVCPSVDTFFKRFPVYSAM